MRDWKNSDRLTAADRAVLQATDDVLANGKISDASWVECKKHVPTEAEQVEMVVCIANWTMFSIILRSLEIPIEDGVMAWPPDGKRPG